MSIRSTADLASVRQRVSPVAVAGALGVLVTFALGPGIAKADEIGCVSTTFRVLGANDKVCIDVFEDKEIPGIACHVSQARTGGIKGAVGVAEDPSMFALACRQFAPIDTSRVNKLADKAKVFDSNTSLLFKETQVYRLYDKPRNTLVYTAISTRVIEGSPMNSISTVPLGSTGPAQVK